MQQNEQTNTEDATQIAPLLSVESLRTSFFTDRGEAKVLDGVTFHINPGEILGLVGETGSGKSVTGYSLLQLVKRPGKVVGGKVWMNDRNLLDMSEKDMSQQIRGAQISMIFQNPRNSINPLIQVGKLITQVIRTHAPGLSKEQAYERALTLLRLVHIPAPEERMRLYAHQLSGGMAQRIMIALAISCNPQLLIADEPTTGLDVTTQAQVLDLLKELNSTNHAAQLFITHDLGVASQHCDRIAVMYAGGIVEEGPAEQILNHPVHPYTRGLVAARPKPAVETLTSMPGSVPDMHHPPSGCRFHPRCPWATEQCSRDKPIMQTTPTTRIACWNWEEALGQNVDRFGS